MGLKRSDPYRVFLIYSVCTRAFMTLVFTVNMVYFVTILKLDPLQMVLVGTVLESAVFIFEVPTGIVADTISRRLSIIIGVFLIGCGFVMQAVFTPFWLILLAQVLWGVGFTFTSGALQAWITDEIGEEQAGPAFLRATQLEQVGAFVAIALSVGLALQGSLRLPMVLGGVFFWFLGFYLIGFMPEEQFNPAPVEERNSWKAMGTTLKTGFGMIKKRPVLIRIFLIGFFYGLYSEGFDRLWVPHILDVFQLPEQGDLIMLAWIGGLSMVSMVFTFFTAGALRKWFGETMRPRLLLKSLTGLSFVLVAALIVLAFSRQIILSFATLLLIGVVRDLIYPIYISWINRGLVSSARATVLSMGSLVDAVGQISGGPISGGIANRVSLPAGILSSAVMLFPVLFIFPGIKERDLVSGDQ